MNKILIAIGLLKMNFRFTHIFLTLLVLGATTTHATNQTSNAPVSSTQQEAMKNLSPEQARQAILKMVGEYQVTFRFEEIYSAKTGYDITPPDISKGFETVIVLENSANKISLQHLLMAGEHVVKHWRQDWEYQPKSMWSYVGNYQWKRQALTVEQSQGKWLQTVWQVDDSPRYAALGEWTTDHGIEAWTSAETQRPLPRRELTTRDDYDVISGINRQAITAEGWVHEQNNIKYDSKTQKPLARELGLNIYERSTVTNFKPAYEYWEKNKAYWAEVRQVWDKAFLQNEVLGLRFTRQKDDDKKAHYVQFMKQAEQFAGKNTPAKQMDEKITSLLNQELTVGQVK